MRRPDGKEPLERTRAARRESSAAERKLWSAIRNRQVDGFKFRRQVWLGPFIADFFCAEARLVVEVDGDTHAIQRDYDDRRTERLRGEGFQVLRFGNRDVMENLPGVLEELMRVLPSPSHSALPSGPRPLPCREREGS